MQSHTGTSERPMRPPDWRGWLVHVPPASSTAKRQWSKREILLWEADPEPVEPLTWSGHLQIAGLAGYESPCAIFGASAIQATMLTWQCLQLATHAVDPLHAMVCGDPGGVDLSEVPTVS
jgi:hypothetical protein